MQHHRPARLLAGLLILGITLLAPSAGIARAHDASVPGPADATIEIGSRNLDPSVRVRAGAVVRFVNRDDERHRMRARSGPTPFDTGDLEPGESFAARLPTAGTIAYADERDRDDARYHGRIEVVGGSTAPTAAPTGTAGPTTGPTSAPTTGPTAAPTTPGGTAGGATGSGGSAPARATVTIGDDFFSPGTVRIARGGTVMFRNTGGDEHSATSTAFDTGTLSGGASAQASFPDAGTFAFICIFHSDMRGTVEVVTAGANASTPPAAPSPTPAPSATPAASATPSPDAAAGAGPTTTTASIVDFAFDPAEITIDAGDTVAWRNDGAAPHTVTASDGAFDSGFLATGATYERTFEAPGRIAYLCALHPEMTGTVVVRDAATAAMGTGSAATTAPADPTAGSTAPASATAAIDAASAGDTGSLGGLAASIVLVSAAGALFARLIRGTVRA